MSKINLTKDKFFELNEDSEFIIDDIIARNNLVSIANVENFEMDKNGEYVAICYEDDSLEILKFENNSYKKIFESEDVFSANISPNGKIALVAYMDDHFEVYTLPDMKPIFKEEDWFFIGSYIYKDEYVIFFDANEVGFAILDIKNKKLDSYECDDFYYKEDRDSIIRIAGNKVDEIDIITRKIIFSKEMDTSLINDLVYTNDYIIFEEVSSKNSEAEDLDLDFELDEDEEDFDFEKFLNQDLDSKTNVISKIDGKLIWTKDDVINFDFSKDKKFFIALTLNGDLFIYNTPKFELKDRLTNVSFFRVKENYLGVISNDNLNIYNVDNLKQIYSKNDVFMFDFLEELEKISILNTNEEPEIINWLK